ncbi:uncharacterized protein LY89DRAFT_777073 [Mollisia scopiformis]|uniref:2EXR domain-containing protein n=1 Tax=Mollisia scopiformis TaxID=149040 RepID=A0A194XSL5_MOLSC|nr:uncharacterized protein LY89DRAFT_777073 [Mollisia scopiformis]KUJ23295.1 hypothetical protein LY89DRAFT_777073 [Mollisia scopiformis]
MASNEDKSQHLFEEFADQAIVQIPSNILTQLVTSVNKLKADVSTLRHENSSLVNQVQDLRDELRGVTHSPFSKLPREIRRLIWKFAMMAPQVHIIGSPSHKQSRVNIVMQACKEAREEGLRLKLPYYRYTCGAPRGVLTSLEYYVNWDVDTFWVPDIQLPVEIVCSRCEPVWNESPLSPCAQPRLIHHCLCRPKHGLYALAMNASRWGEPGQTDFFTGRAIHTPVADLANYYSIQKLYIVINYTEPLTCRNIAFVEPTKQGPTLGEDVSTTTWHAMAEEKMALLEAYKARKILERQAKLDAGERVYSFDDFANWKVPSIEYVEHAPA